MRGHPGGAPFSRVRGNPTTPPRSSCRLTSPGTVRENAPPLAPRRTGRERREDVSPHHTGRPYGGERTMPRLAGWKRLLADADWCRGPGGFPLPAYSEFLPPPWVVVKPYSGPDPHAYQKSDRCGWNVSEYEEAHEL